MLGVLALGALVVVGLADPAGHPAAGPAPDDALTATGTPTPARPVPASRSTPRAPVPTLTPAPTPTPPADDAPAREPVSPAPDEVGTPPAPAPPATFEDAVAEATNAARQEHGLAPLARSACADDLARRRAAALVGTGRLEHAPLDEVLRGCRASSAGENLVRAGADAAGMVRLWLDSPGHRANVLHERYTHLGVGCADDGPQRICAQVFLG